MKKKETKIIRQIPNSKPFEHEARNSEQGCVRKIQMLRSILRQRKRMMMLGLLEGV